MVNRKDDRSANQTTSQHLKLPPTTFALTILFYFSCESDISGFNYKRSTFFQSWVLLDNKLFLCQSLPSSFLLRQLTSKIVQRNKFLFIIESTAIFFAVSRFF
jgi:hypothetical protein